MNEFFIWAHRGFSAQAPENTMAAFAAAAAAGADGIELDVHLSRDGVAVVIHDETVDRTTNGRGKVVALTLKELKQLDAGGWFSPQFSGEEIPTLEEVLQWASGRGIPLNIEVKTSTAGKQVLSLLEALPGAEVLISSFNHRLLLELRRAAPALPLGFVTEAKFWGRGLKKAQSASAYSFHPRHDRLSPSLVERCHRAGLRVFPWTVDRSARMLGIKKMGGDGLFTNQPQKAVTLRQSDQ